MNGIDPEFSESSARAGAPANLDPRSILSSVGELVYSWDIESDRLTWSQNATEVLGVAEAAQISSGAGYAVLTDTASPASLQSTIFQCQRKDKGTGVPYSARYLINPAPGRRVWVEDKGRWFADSQGRPWLAHGVVRIISTPTDAEASISNTRQVDPATGALTRADFSNALAEALNRVRGDKRNLVLLIVAIEELAHLNRTFGHSVGDEVIAAVARRIKSHTRKLDKIGRYAGNKIGVLLAPSLPDDMERTAMRIAGQIKATPIDTSAGTISAHVRIGGVAAPRDVAEPAEALSAAEEALSDAKASKTNIYAGYSRNSERVTARRANAAASDEVIAALNDQRIALAFQPIVHARTRGVAMYEALVRLRSRTGELLGAGQIVPVAEKLGIVHLVDHRVLELAVRALHQNPLLRLTINAGVSTAMHPEWLPALQAQLSLAPEVAPRLVVEITETSLIDDLTGAVKMVEAIKALGARVAIDDFGAGHTSFRNMRMLPIDILKIDGAFIKNLNKSSDDRFFVRTLLQLAGHLKIETVAEWVQDEESAAMLAEWGVAYLQGDHIGDPLSELPVPIAPRAAVA